MWKWILIKENCTGCGICKDVCNYDAINMTREMAYPEGVEGNCTGCRDCLEECPFAAIEIQQTEKSPA